uniref:Uncharacterized protein n=1 Tax=Cacopsylla melanoneura TaxID=428564 RepID=A0A8D8X2V5_9HEMI
MYLCFICFMLINDVHYYRYILVFTLYSYPHVFHLQISQREVPNLPTYKDAPPIPPPPYYFASKCPAVGTFSIIYMFSTCNYYHHAFFMCSYRLYRIYIPNYGYSCIFPQDFLVVFLFIKHDISSFRVMSNTTSRMTLTTKKTVTLT